MTIDPAAASTLDASFVRLLSSSRHDFLTTDPETSTSTIHQCGVARLPMTGWPGWPSTLPSEHAIETYVATEQGVAATSDNEPFVTAWRPLVEWVDRTVRSSLEAFGVVMAADAFVTVSKTETNDLEGTAHVDDDVFTPAESVDAVAIIGELAGPRVAWGKLTTRAIRPMSAVTFEDDLLSSFEHDRLPHTACPPDQLVIFPQFGQLHAGPAAHHVASIGAWRQLVVYRVKLPVA